MDLRLTERILFMKNKRPALIVLIVLFIISAIAFCVTETIVENRDADGDIVVEKPVIYLYPEKDNTDVSVSLDIDGEFLALDPEFNIPNGWKVKANKDGNIIYNDATYPYLFWEADLNFTVNMYSGFCIKGKDTEKFLEETLPKLSLNEKETEDFIAYWAPKMSSNSYNLISFQEDNYEAAAKLDIAPKPDSVIRVFMAYMPVDHYIKINEQKFDDIPERTGFTVVEWGGAELDSLYQKRLTAY